MTSPGAAGGGAPVVDAFCDALWLEDGLAKNTLASYRQDLRHLEALLKGASLLDAGEEQLFRFLAARRGRASSAARMLSTLKRFYGWCLRERRIAADGIGGFGHATGGYLLEAKRWLLMHERRADAFALAP